MKIEQVLVQQLHKNKEITLQGIGTFRIDSSVTLPSESDKATVLPENAITFEYNPRAVEDPALIDAIVIHTKKIKPLASADLDSYLMLGRQFLNIGKPFTIEGLGTLDKTMAGDLVFKPGHFITPKLEPPKTLKEDEMEEKSGLFPDYDTEIRRSYGKRAMLIILIILVLGFGAWAAYHYIIEKRSNEKTVSENQPRTTTDSTKKDSVVPPPQQLQQTASNDSYSFKVVFKETSDKEDARKSFAKMKEYGHKVIMYSNDSVTWKVAEPFTLPLSDTTHVLDSLNRYYYLGKARIER